MRTVFYCEHAMPLPASITQCHPHIIRPQRQSGSGELLDPGISKGINLNYGYK